MTVAQVIEILRRLGEADFDGTAALLAADFVQEYPFPPMTGVPERITGIEPFLAFIRPGMTAFEPYRYSVEHIYECSYPHKVVAEYRSHSQMRSTGRPYSNHYVGVFDFDDHDLLRRWREYLNPDVITAVMADIPDPAAAPTRTDVVP